MSSSRSRLVAATTRTSTGIGSVPPTGIASRSCSTRSSFTWVAGDISPISSRKKVPHRPRERPFDVAEQLRLEQALRQRAAVEREEPPVRARRQLVDVARDDFFSCPRLALDEHRALGGRHLLSELQHLLKRARLAQRLHEPGPLAPADLLLEL